MAQNYNKHHKCENMPKDVEFHQIYLPTEISWNLEIAFYNKKNVVIIGIKENITYCPYCGIKLSRDFN